MLIEFEPGHRYTYFTLAEVEGDLSALLGQRVDLPTHPMVGPNGSHASVNASVTLTRVFDSERAVTGTMLVLEVKARVASFFP